MKVLFVDDDEDIRKQAKMFLENEDNEIKLDISRSYEDAIEKLKTERYEAIVSDYHMPKKNGIHLLKYRNENNSDTPFLIFTGKGEERVAMKALNNGADRYIIKEEPISEKYKLLERAIKREVERKSLEEDLDRSYKLIQKTLDSLPSAVVILNGNGEIIRKNEAWCNAADKNYMMGDYEVGDNYFENMKESIDDGSENVKKAYEGLKDLSDDKDDVYTLEYSISRHDFKKKYVMRATKFYLDRDEYIVISHLDITESG